MTQAKARTNKKDCRECMLGHLGNYWTDDTFCKKVLEGTEVPTPEQWMACLESNGVCSKHAYP
jgi:hypothetical protein